MEIVQKLINKNRSYKNFIPAGMVLHETANPGDNNELEFNYFNNNSVSASAHLFVDTDSVFQMVPFNEVAWHCGKTGNRKFLGCELCHATSKEDFEKIWNNGVQTFAHVFVNILKIDVVTPDNLPSHAELSLKYKETNHMDPIDYFAKFGKTVDNFRSDVQKSIDALKKVDWKQIIKKVSDAPERWEKGIISAVEAAKSNGNLGDLEIFEFLPVLIEKIYNSKN